MSDATEKYAAALGWGLSKSNGWQQGTSTLLSDSQEVPLFTRDSQAAVLIVPGDGITPPKFRSFMEGLVKKASAPAKQPEAQVPWSSIFVLFVFEGSFPDDLRAFIGNDRRNFAPPRYVQGGWVALGSGEASFRSNKTALEAEVLQAVQKAAQDVHSGGTPLQKAFATGRDREPATARKPKKRGSPLVPALLGLAVVGGGGYYAYTELVAKPGGGAGKPPAATAAAERPAAPATAAGGSSSKPAPKVATKHPASGHAAKSAPPAPKPAAPAAAPKPATAAATPAPPAPPKPAPPAPTPAAAAPKPAAPAPPPAAPPAAPVEGPDVALAAKGHTLLERGEFGEALRNFDEALTKNPKCAAARQGKGIAYTMAAEETRRQDDTQALRLYTMASGELQQAVQLNPKDAAALLHLGICSYRTGNAKAARELLSRSIASQPTAEAYGQRAMCAAQLKDDAAAVADYSKAYELKKDPHYLFGRGNCYLRMGKQREAGNDYSGVKASGVQDLASSAIKNLDAFASSVKVGPSPMPKRHPLDR